MLLASRAAVKVLRITHGLIWRVPISAVEDTSRAAAAFVGLISVAMLAGAGVVALGTVLLHAATVYWFAYETRAKSETYGAIGASLALLLWRYMLGRIITAAASINAAFWYRNEERAGRSVPSAVDLEGVVLS